MGTRINVLLDHNLTDHSDRESVLRRLAATLPAALAVRDYWHTADPNFGPEKLDAWRADPMASCDSNLHRYTTPGSLFLQVTKHAARIRTGGRWRGFLDIEPLRRVHLAAFREIACALGATSVALYADSGEVDDLFWGGHTQWECIKLMEQMWGPPQKSVDEIEEREILAAESKWMVPFIWFLERTRNMPVAPSAAWH